MAQNFKCGACKARNLGKGFHHCCLCNVHFMMLESYERHNNLYHAESARVLPIASFTCLDCSKDFYDEAAFNHHLIQHQVIRAQFDAVQAQLDRLTSKTLAVPSAPFTCLDCSMGFYDEASFTMHLDQHKATISPTDRPADNVHRGADKARELPKTPITCLGCYTDFYDGRVFNLHSCQPGMSLPGSSKPNRKRTCPICNTVFAKKRFLREHRRFEGQCKKVPKVKIRHPCQKCGATFKKTKTLKKHTRACGMPKEANPKSSRRGSKRSQPKIFICNNCGKDFATKKLRKAHRCTANGRYNCLNLKCSRSFKLVASLINHLESGVCGSGYDRETINRLICERDTKGLVTVPGARNALEAYTNPGGILTSTESGIKVIADDGTSDSSSDAGSMDNTPDDSSDDEFDIPTPSYSVSEASFNIVSNTLWEGDSHVEPGTRTPYEDDLVSLDSWNSELTWSSSTPSMAISTPSIVISDPGVPQNTCYICRKTFRKFTTLQRHLASPAHAPALYHCGLSFLGVDIPGKEKTFKTLSGLVMHLERGACRGGKPTFDLGMSVLSKLAEEFGFGAEELAKFLGGRFIAKRQNLLAGSQDEGRME
ncbi:hypothetical protein ABW20_dc0108644 [Dactylellina cionopaga]|nr:hypothetical protein ABW20_dc0108644 [Dactylellina cionopaga]